jgi:hypothetical protein
MLEIYLYTMLYSNEVILLLQYILMVRTVLDTNGCELWSLILNKIKIVGTMKGWDGY